MNDPETKDAGGYGGAEGGSTAAAKQTVTDSAAHSTDEKEIVDGWSHFRNFINRKLVGQRASLPYGETRALWSVQEMLPDGRLRLKNPTGQDFGLIAFDDKVIETLIRQLVY